AADPPALLLHARRCARRARRTEYPVVRDWLAVSNVAADARLLAIDTDGDGDDEVLVSGAGGGTVVLGEGRLPRNFDAGVPDARATVAFDADGDCALDLAGLSPEGGFVQVRSESNDVRRVGLGARSLAVGDLLGDGRVSVALATPSAVVIVAVDAPTDVYALRADDATHVGVTDLDGDLQADLVISAATGTSAWRASGGTFVAHAATFPEAVAAARGPVSFGDLDADGRVDVVVADARLVRVARSVGAMGYVEASVVTLSRPAIHLRVGDVDGDCQDDVVAVDEGGTLALFRAGAGATLTRVLLSLGLAVDAVFADVDGDGPRELVVLERSGAVRVVGS
ncbi:MAG: VCBS repeat-containing protein, partial [Myxococcales bacterium]|nr:VCBS repeat-containing protein [Myxococcales bacterium]